MRYEIKRIENSNKVVVKDTRFGDSYIGMIKDDGNVIAKNELSMRMIKLAVAEEKKIENMESLIMDMTMCCSKGEAQAQLLTLIAAPDRDAIIAWFRGNESLVKGFTPNEIRTAAQNVFNKAFITNPFYN